MGIGTVHFIFVTARSCDRNSDLLSRADAPRERCNRIDGSVAHDSELSPTPARSLQELVGHTGPDRRFNHGHRISDGLTHHRIPHIRSSHVFTDHCSTRSRILRRPLGLPGCQEQQGQGNQRTHGGHGLHLHPLRDRRCDPPGLQTVTTSL